MKNKRTLIILSLLLLSLPLLAGGCMEQNADAGPQYPSPPASENRPYVAVPEFENKSHVHRMGRGMADELESELVNSGWFRVMSRQEIDDILEEQNLQMQFGDPSSAVETGKLLGVEYLIYGSVTSVSESPYGLGDSELNVSGSRIKVNANLKMVSVETGEIIAAPNVRGSTVTGGVNIGGNVSLTGETQAAAAIQDANRDAVTDAVNQLIQSVQNR